MDDNMFSSDGWERVVYCKDCIHSYTLCNVPKGSTVPVPFARRCEINDRLVSDNAYCSYGVSDNA